MKKCSLVDGFSTRFNENSEVAYFCTGPRIPYFAPYCTAESRGNFRESFTPSLKKFVGIPHSIFPQKPPCLYLATKDISFRQRRSSKRISREPAIRRLLLAWRSGNSVGYINKVHLHRTIRIGDLGRVYHLGIIQITQAYSAWPPSVDRCNEYWW